MQLGWIDFSKDERNKVLNVIHLLDEPGAVDELGLGAIRDGFADYFFPGTSTVQTRAKYFLIVPYILKEAGSGLYGDELNAVIRKIDLEERLCRDILIKTSSDGVIGSRTPSSWVIRTPSNIYWNGIKKLGIFDADLSIKEYVHHSIFERTIKRTKVYGNRDKDAEENEKDDVDAGDISSHNFWRLGSTYRKEWRKNLTIDLLPEEAAFLKSQIIAYQRDTLFAYILKNNINLDKYDSFGALSEELKNKVNQELKDMMVLANNFNKLAALITTRYNLIVSQGKNEDALYWWGVFSSDIKTRCSVDLREIFKRLSIHNTRLCAFLFQIQAAFKNGEISRVDELIVARERGLKGTNRAKTQRIGEYPEQEWIGSFMFDYRYTPAKRIISDIMNAGVGSNV